MEDVLGVYKRPYDPLRPLVCLDESSKQHILEIATPIPLEPGKPERYDTEYKGNGVSNLFMMFEPLTGWRHVEVTDHRTAVDWAHQIKFLVEVRHRDAEKIILL